jgi:hypothetical protein
MKGAGVSRMVRWLLPILLIPVLCAIWVLRPDSHRRKGNRVVDEVKTFQRTHGRLPDSLTEIGESGDESGPVYYQNQGDQSFIVWYGLRLGESEVYDSKTGRWDEHD